MKLTAWSNRLTPMRDVIGRDPLVWSLTLIMAVIYLALAGRYDTFRNELYFIVCGRHPAFGYVDLPPLVPLIAAATQFAGDSTWLLRLPAIAAALALIPLTATLCRTLGGTATAAWMAALAAAIAPMLIGIQATLFTSTFEPLTWTLCAYLIARAAIEGNRSAALWAGVVAGVALEAKYGIAIWLMGLGIGMIATSVRRLLSWRELWYGALIGALIAAPSLIWQAVNGWPFLAVIHFAATHRNLTGSPIHFIIGQIFGMNPLLAPLWITGVIAPFIVTRLRDTRFLSIAFVIATAVIILAHGKDYYLAPAYPAMFATGAVICAGLWRWLRMAWLTGAVALSLFAAPVVLPILSPVALDHYLRVTNLRPHPSEVEALGAPLTQIFSDELGWRKLEQQVAAVYWSLPPDQRARAAIITADYGEAAAIDVYGRRDGLPPALCGSLQYYLWGTHGYDGSVIIRVNGNPDRWRRLCRDSAIAGRFGAPYVMPYENGPIIVCYGLVKPLSEVWPMFKRYR